MANCKNPPNTPKSGIVPEAKETRVILPVAGTRLIECFSVYLTAKDKFNCTVLTVQQKELQMSAYSVALYDRYRGCVSGLYSL